MRLRPTLIALRDAVFPSGAILLAAAALVHWGPLEGVVPAARQFAPPVVLVAGVLLAWRFHRGRILLALVTLAAAELGLTAAGTGGAGAVVATQAIGVLVPLNLMGLALLPERGLLTLSGMLRWTVLATEVLIVLALAIPEPAPAAALLLHEPLPSAIFAWSGLEAGALAGFAVAGIVLLAGVVMRPNATGRGFFWAVVAAFLALQLFDAETARRLYLTAGGLILATAVVEASYFMAYRDGLTGLPGRRAFDEALLRLRTRYAVAMVDVDRFKRVNDTHGHDVGDQILRMVAARLARVGGGGRAYRYGGEEFAVLFPGKSVEEALPHMETLRAGVAEDTFALRAPDRPTRKPERPSRSGSKPRGLSVTVSAGLAGPADRKTTPEEVVQAADQALYRAKQGGRNRVAR
jgi:diguanylate cyclase (GGDEF)-like protein